MNGINPYGIALDEFAAPSDTTTLNATTSAHGLLPKLGGGTTNFLRADGTWNAPTAGIGGTTGSTDNAILRADGTGGSTIQTSGVTISDAGVVSAKGTAASVAAYYSDGTKNVAISHDGTNSCVTSSAGSVKLVPQAGAYGTILSDSILRVPSTFQVQTTGGGVMYDVSQSGLFRLIDATVGGLKYFGLAPLAGGVGAEVNSTTAGIYRWLAQAGHKRVDADVTNATATMSVITGLSESAMLAGRKFFGFAVLKCNDSQAAEGIKIDFDASTATMTSFWAAASILVGGVTVVGTAISTSLAGDINFTTITGETIILVMFSGVVKAAGTLAMRFAQDTHTTGTATIELGSFMWLEDSP